jgi:hypothetical protein
MAYKIKDEYIGTTVKIYDRFQGTKTIVVDNLDLTKVDYYMTTGLKRIFEEVTPEPIVIEYTAIEDVPVKKKRTKKFVERLEEVKQEQESNNGEA